MYSVVIYNYKSGIFSELGEYTDKRHALLALEEYVLEYIAKRDGFTKITDEEKKDVNKISDQQKIKNITFAIDKFDLRGKAVGHYIVKNPADHVNKLEIWQKEKVQRSSPGYLYNSYYIDNRITKVFDIDVLYKQKACAGKVTGTGEIDCVYKNSRVEAHKLWGNYTKALLNSDVFRWMSSSENPNIPALRKEHPDAFKKYVKKTNKLSIKEKTNG